MIDLALLRHESPQKEELVARLEKRGVSRQQLDQLLTSDNEFRQTQQQVDELRAQKKKISKQANQAAEVRRQAKVLSQQEKGLAKKLKLLEAQRDTLWRQIPNIPAADVQAGDEPVVLETPRVPVTPGFAAKDYLALCGEQLLDIERAAKVSGSRFTYFKGPLVLLQFGLVRFILDQLSKEGFMPVIPPVLISEKTMSGMGYLEQASEEVYKTQDSLFLVGTSEQSIGPMHMNEIFNEAQLPLRYVAYSTCFRREAGSHGKDVRGIMRLHQFDKVEMFSFASPADSPSEHEFLLQQQKVIMDALELPYRVVRLGARDIGAPSAKTYDIETWIPSEQRYRETHSTSNTTDYQARRLNIRVRTKDGRTQKVHMLNGTAAAMSRLFIALLENHQRADGSIAIPPALHPYLSFTTI